MTDRAGSPKQRRNLPLASFTLPRQVQALLATRSVAAKAAGHTVQSKSALVAAAVLLAYGDDRRRHDDAAARARVALAAVRARAMLAMLEELRPLVPGHAGRALVAKLRTECWALIAAP